MLDRPRRELGAALLLLTRLPTAWLLRGAAPADIARSVWAWPLVGALVGGLGGATAALAAQAGLPPLAGGLLGVAIMMLVTGALHEDGLADTADALGAGGDATRALAIMRDSRIGTFGALALCLSVGLRAACLAAHPAPAPMLAAAALGRAGMLAAALTLPPARSEGLGASLGPPPLRASAVGMVIALGVLLAADASVAALFAAAFVVAVIGRLARRRIGGQTGDVLGAVEQLVECATLLLLVRAA